MPNRFRLLGFLAGMLLAPPALGLDILDALNRGQRLEKERCTFRDPGSAEAEVIRSSFDKVVQAAGAVTPVIVRVAECRAVVQVLGGEILVHPSVATWDEGERLFALAHELGHVVNGDWGQLTGVFQEEVTAGLNSAQVSLVLRRIGPRLSALMHDFEYQADAFALKVLADLGRNGLADGVACIKRVPMPPGSPTHPGSEQRIARLAGSHQGATGN